MCEEAFLYAVLHAICSLVGASQNIISLKGLNFLAAALGDEIAANLLLNCHNFCQPAVTEHELSSSLPEQN